MNEQLVNHADKPIGTFVFAHGAGAGQHSDFMQYMADAISSHGVNVIRFNFAYMQLAEELGKRRPPDRADKLLNHMRALLSEVDSTLPLFIGGKSMGGRIASMLLGESRAMGCICMGYPFHPPGKPEKLRTEHLEKIEKPVLILQGERDTFGTREDIAEYTLSKQVKVQYLPDSDHSFKPRKASGFSLEQNLQQAVEHTVKFIQQTSSEPKKG